MVLRKPPPPGIEVPQRTNVLPNLRSPVSPAKINPKPQSGQTASSPGANNHPVKDININHLSRGGGPQVNKPVPRPPAQVSVYSPDLNTSPAFDLMPLEQAQKSPVASFLDPQNPQNPWVDDPTPPSPPQLDTPTQLPSESKEETRPGLSRIPPVLMAGTTRRQAADELQRNQPHPEMYSDSEHPHPLQSNNPFLKAKSPGSNPWENVLGGHSEQQLHGPVDQESCPWINHPNTHVPVASERISQSG